MFSLKLSFSHFNFYEENPLKQRCSFFFFFFIPVKNAYAVMEFQEEALSQKIIHQLKYRSQEKLEKSWLNGLWKEFTFQKNQMF